MNNLSNYKLIYFSSPTCTPCKILQKNVIRRLKREEPTLKIVKYDITNEDDNKIAFQYKVRALPTILLFYDDQIVYQANNNANHLYDTILKIITK